MLLYRDSNSRISPMCSILYPSRHSFLATFIFWSMEIFILLLVILFYFILFLFILNIAILEGKVTFKCINYSFPEIPWSLLKIPSQLVYRNKIYSAHCAIFLPLVHFPTAWNLVNSQHFRETIRDVADGLCTPTFQGTFCIFDLCTWIFASLLWL